jgi:hypothetical protein
LRREDGNAVLVTLYGEIIFLREQVALAAKIIASFDITGGPRGPDAQFCNDYMPPEPLVFHRLVEKLGAINAVELISIIKFYTNYLNARSSLHMISSERDPSYAPTAFLVPAHDAVVNIEPTLRTIESSFGISESKRPALGYTSEVIDKYEGFVEGT